MAEVTCFTGMRVRVRIDLNSRTPDGLVRTRMSSAARPVRVGEPVLAYEPEDGVVAEATVAAVDDDLGFLYLDVDWSTVHEDHYRPEPHMRVSGLGVEGSWSGLWSTTNCVQVRESLTVDPAGLWEPPSELHQ